MYRRYYFKTMKTISLKTGYVMIPGSKDGVKQTTIQVINSALDSSDPSQGLTVADFRARARVDRKLDAIAEGQESLELTDEEFATIKKAVESSKWVIRTSVLKDLISELFPEEDVLVAETV